MRRPDSATVSQVSLLLLNSNEVLENSNAQFQIELAGIVYPTYTVTTFNQAITVGTRLTVTRL
jgi:hypothetical protein